MLSPVMKALSNAALTCSLTPFFINNQNFEISPKLFNKLTRIYHRNGLLIVNLSFLIYDHFVYKIIIYGHIIYDDYDHNHNH